MFSEIISNYLIDINVHLDTKGDCGVSILINCKYWQKQIIIEYMDSPQLLLEPSLYEILKDSNLQSLMFIAICNRIFFFFASVSHSVSEAILELCVSLSHASVCEP